MEDVALLISLFSSLATKSLKFKKTLTCFLNINILEVQIINSTHSDEPLEWMSHGL